MERLPGALRQQADRRFLAQRGISWQAAPKSTPVSPAERLQRARVQQRRLTGAIATPDTAATPGAWQSIGPAHVATVAYGEVTGRITSLAADPNDSTGNTLYLGATGGGVWKSTNAAGSQANVSFSPLTDNLPAFAANNGPFSGTLSSISIGALTVQPSSANVVLAGTGDINDALDSYYGVGILRSADGGDTWTLISGSKDAQQGGLQNYNFTGNGFAGFAWSSATPSLVIAAVAQSAEGILVNAGSTQNMEAGLYYSSDAGQTWYLAVIEDSSTQIVQSPYKVGSPPGNSATSVVWNPVRHRFYAAIRFHGYYESLDGITWTRLANQPGLTLSTTACPSNPGSLGSTACPIFRGALAVQPVTGDLFALTTDLNNLDQGLFQDVCSTSGLAVSSCASSTVTFANQIASGALENGGGDTTIPLADYDLTLSAISSQQTTILFAGTEDIYRCSLANSCAWRNTTNIETCAAAQVAPSQHATEGTFGSTGLLYFANDGGLWRSTDAVAQTGSVCAATDAGHYQNLNTGIGSLAEIEHFSVSPGSSSTLLAGMGGFGTIATNGPQGSWQQLLTGEGSYTAIDPANTQNWYTESGSGVDIHRCTAGANCGAVSFGATAVIGSAQIEGDADYFSDPAPWILDPLNTANLLLGTCRVWRGPATGGWSPSSLLSPMLDGNQQPFCDGNAQLRSIGAGLDANAPAGSEEMYAGMAGPYDGGGTTPGHIFSSTVPTNGGATTWTDLYNSPVSNSSNNPQFNTGGFAVSSIAVDPHDATGHTLYATVQGFSGNGISDGEVYGSTDGGAHWLNLTNSLPLAPANSIVVDPNVPSILYVALDTGVYYTQNLAACSDPTQTCWAVYGSGLPNAPVTSLQVYSAGASSILEASTYGRGIWALGLLTAPSQGTLSPPSYTFPGQQIAVPSAASAFILANTGYGPMTIISIQAVGDYAETNSCGASLPVGASCTIQVTFTPTLAGDRPGTLTVYANVSGGRLSSTLDGVGLTPGMLTPTPASLTFPGTVKGVSSAAESVSVQNTGGIAVQLQAFAVTTDYSLSSNSCGSTLAPGASCTVGIVLTPSAIGDRPGHLSMPSNAAGSPTVVPLDGTGFTPPALTLTPASLTFPNTARGSVSASQSILVTDSGEAPAQLQAPTVAGDYQVTGDTCGSMLAAGATCVIQIAFDPTAIGSRAGLLTIPANVSGGQATATLSGAGVTPAALALSPTALTFPSTTTGVTSAAQSVLVTSTGGVAVQLGVLSVTGDYAISSNPCGSTLAPGASCTLQITFTPSALGDRPGQLKVPANIAGSQVTAALDGTGVSPPALTLTPTLLTFSATAVGATSAAQSIAVANNGGTPAQLMTAIASGDFAVSGNNCGTSIAPGAQCTLQITFSPSATGTRTGILTLAGTNFSIAAANARTGRLRSAATPDTAGQVTAALSGLGVAPPIVTFSPSPGVFNDQAQGSASPPKSITVTNTGAVAALMQAPSITGNFYISGSTCPVSPVSFASTATCVIQVYFHPATTGGLSGSLLLSGTMAGGQASDLLSGTGLAPGSLALTPGSLTFGGVLLGSTSTPQTITATNITGIPLTLPGAVITGDYADYAITADNCGSTLAPNSSCAIQIVFRPIAAGDRPVQLQQADGVSGDPIQEVNLDGTGLKPGSVALTPSALNFGSVAVGTSSSSSSLSAANTGDVSVQLQTPFLTGDYTSTTNCGGTLAANTACSLQVTFNPAAPGNRPGTLTLPSTAVNTPAIATLGGNGLPAGNLTLAPASTSFPSTVVGATSATRTLTATNSGGVPVRLGAPAVSPDYQVLSTTCTGTLAAGTSCVLQLAFAPTASGDRPGTLTFPGQFAGSPATAALDGNALAAGALSLSPASLGFPSVVTGMSSPPMPITVTNSGGVAVQLGTASAAGDYSVQTSGCPASLAPQASCTLQVVFTPTAAGDRPGLLTVPGNIAGNQVTATLDGTGALPGALSLSSPLLSFGPVVLGNSSAGQTLTITNGGGASVNLQTPVTSSAEYQVKTNSCGSVLPAGQQCALGIAFTPVALGDQQARLTVSASNGVAPAYATLDGSGLAPVQLAFTPTALAFAPVQDGKSSPQQTVTLTNSGGVAAQLALPVLSGQYALTNNCGASLSPSASCTMQVTFSPTTAGLHPGTLTVTTSDTSSSAAVSLSGSSTPPPSLVLTPTAEVFPTIGVGVTSAAQNITVANVGAGTINLQAFTITGDFAISADTCTGTPLRPTYSCTLSITFTPTASGLRTGLLTVSDGVETHTATLNGTGLGVATDTLSTTSLTFGPQTFGTVSAAQSVSMTNSGGSTLGAISTTVTGPFAAANNCGTMLGGGLSCSFSVTFSPTGGGAQTGQLTITDAQRSQIVSLGGQGVLPSSPVPSALATPLSLDFNDVVQGKIVNGFAVGATTPAQIVTVTNNGNTPLAGFTAATSVSSFAIVANTCGSTLDVGSSCTLSVTFTPQQPGNVGGQVTLTSASLNSPLTVGLNGSGEDFQLSVSGSASALITNGQTATYQLVVTPVGSSAGTLTFACTGAPANSSCTVKPATLGVAGPLTGSLTVSIVTGLSATGAWRPSSDHGFPWRVVSALALLLPCLLLRGRTRRAFLMLLVTLALVLAPIACGVHASGGSSAGSGGAGGSGSGSTSPGTYAITVTASFPGAQRTAALTLTVE